MDPDPVFETRSDPDPVFRIWSDQDPGFNTSKVKLFLQYLLSKVE
mgnify:CR=1 FL=1